MLGEQFGPCPPFDRSGLRGRFGERIGERRGDVYRRIVDRIGTRRQRRFGFVFGRRRTNEPFGPCDRCRRWGRPRILDGSSGRLNVLVLRRRFGLPDELLGHREARRFRRLVRVLVLRRDHSIDVLVVRTGTIPEAHQPEQACRVDIDVDVRAGSGRKIDGQWFA